MKLPIVGKVNKPTPWLIGLAVVGLLGVSGIAYTVSRRGTPNAQDVAKVTVPVTQKDLTVQIAVSGSVVAVRTVNLSPKTAGRVTRLYVEQGDRVRQGQVIAEMESTDLQAQIVQAQASVAQSQARLDQARAGNRPEDITQAQSAIAQAQFQVSQAQSRLSLAQQRVQRNQSLANQGAISRDSLDVVLNEERSAQGNLSQSQARVGELQQRLALLRSGSRPEEIELAAAQLTEAQGRLQAIETQLADTIIRAPFSGTITQKYAIAGAFVTPTTSASATSSATSSSIVALESGLELLAQVPEKNISQIKLGQPVQIVAKDAYPDKTFEGRVRLIAPVAVREQNVNSFQVRVSLVTGREVLRSGMNADIKFVGGKIDNAFVVPTVAIVTCQGEQGALVPDGQNVPQFQPVKTGYTDSVGNTQVLTGLQPNQRVFMELPPGAKQPKKCQSTTDTGSGES